MPRKPFGLSSSEQLLSFGSPLPGTPAIPEKNRFRFPVLRQAIENRCDRSQRIFVAGKDGGHPTLEMVADLSGRQRTYGLHQNNSARVRKAAGARAGFLAQETLKLIRKDIVSKELGQAHDGLLHGADSLNDLRALLQEIPQFQLCGVDDLMHAGVVGTPTGYVS